MKRGDTAGLRELAKAVKAFTADDSHKVFEEH